MAGAAKPPHKAKPSKKRSLVRSAKNKATGKYAKQRTRTERNKARRAAGDTAKQRRIARRRAERESQTDETRDPGDGAAAPSPKFFKGSDTRTLRSAVQTGGYRYGRLRRREHDGEGQAASRARRVHGEEAQGRQEERHRQEVRQPQEALLAARGGRLARTGRYISPLSVAGVTMHVMPVSVSGYTTHSGKRVSSYTRTGTSHRLRVGSGVRITHTKTRYSHRRTHGPITPLIQPGNARAMSMTPNDWRARRGVDFLETGLERRRRVGLLDALPSGGPRRRGGRR